MKNKNMLTLYLLGILTGLVIAIVCMKAFNTSKPHDTIHKKQYVSSLFRKAINMEDRTVSFISVKSKYDQHEFVWVDSCMNVCDACRDATMYMILDPPPEDSLILDN